VLDILKNCLVKAFPSKLSSWCASYPNIYSDFKFIVPFLTKNTASDWVLKLPKPPSVVPATAPYMIPPGSEPKPELN
jgi:hypothetical protein